MVKGKHDTMTVLFTMGGYVWPPENKITRPEPRPEP